MVECPGPSWCRSVVVVEQLRWMLVLPGNVGGMVAGSNKSINGTPTARAGGGGGGAIRSW